MWRWTCISRTVLYYVWIGPDAEGQRELRGVHRGGRPRVPRGHLRHVRRGGCRRDALGAREERERRRSGGDGDDGWQARGQQQQRERRGRFRGSARAHPPHRDHQATPGTCERVSHPRDSARARELPDLRVVIILCI